MMIVLSQTSSRVDIPTSLIIQYKTLIRRLKVGCLEREQAKDQIVQTIVSSKFESKTGCMVNLYAVSTNVRHNCCSSMLK